MKGQVTFNKKLFHVYFSKRNKGKALWLYRCKKNGQKSAKSQMTKVSLELHTQVILDKQSGQ